MNGVITGDIFSAQDDSPEVQKFVKAFRAKHGADPGKVHLVFYEGVKVIAGAMEKAKTSNDQASIERAMRDGTWSTPRGTLKFDEKGRAHAPFFYIQRVKDQTLQLVERSKSA